MLARRSATRLAECSVADVRSSRERVVFFLDTAARRAHQRLLREFLSEHLTDGRPLRAYEVWERSGWTTNAPVAATPR